MRIIITGSPGTGKSTLCAMLAKKLGLDIIDLKKHILAHKLSKRGEVELKKLSHSLRSLKTRESFILEGHLACEILIPADIIFVLRTNPKVLERRLKKRGYSKNKISENTMAEMLDYCTQRTMLVYGKKPLELETSGRSASVCIKIMESAIKQKKKKIDLVDYSVYLKAHLGVDSL